MKNNIRNIKKNKGFTILEVLFAIVILSIALSMIFVLLNNMFKVVGRVKKLSFQIDKTPIIFSSSSPLLHIKNIENYKSEFFALPEYTEKTLFNKEGCTSLKTTFIATTEKNKNFFNSDYYSNIIFIPLKSKNQDREKNET